MKATLLLKQRISFADDAFVELVIWQLPKSLPGSLHSYKYRLAFVIADSCVVRYDNEAGKGDHRHTVEGELTYAFTSPNKLVQDFLADAQRIFMKTVILDVRPVEDALEDFVSVWKTGKGQTAARISFATPELLWKVLTAKRWELLKALCGAGPVTVREAAKKVNRDVKAVHGDLTALRKAGVIDRTETGRVEFPYKTIKVEFMLQAA